MNKEIKRRSEYGKLGSESMITSMWVRVDLLF